MYQKCPVCGGSGSVVEEQTEYNKITTAPYNPKKTCPTCIGERIIHVESGKPPAIHNPVFIPSVWIQDDNQLHTNQNPPTYTWTVSSNDTIDVTLDLGKKD